MNGEWVECLFKLGEFGPYPGYTDNFDSPWMNAWFTEEVSRIMLEHLKLLEFIVRWEVQIQPEPKPSRTVFVIDDDGDNLSDALAYYSAEFTVNGRSMILFPIGDDDWEWTIVAKRGPKDTASWGETHAIDAKDILQSAIDSVETAYYNAVEPYNRLREASEHYAQGAGAYHILTPDIIWTTTTYSGDTETFNVHFIVEVDDEFKAMVDKYFEVSRKVGAELTRLEELEAKEFQKYIDEIDRLQQKVKKLKKGSK